MGVGRCLKCDCSHKRAATNRPNGLRHHRHRLERILRTHSLRAGLRAAPHLRASAGVLAVGPEDLVAHQEADLVVVLDLGVLAEAARWVKMEPRPCGWRATV